MLSFVVVMWAACTLMFKLWLLSFSEPVSELSRCSPILQNDNPFLGQTGFSIVNEFIPIQYYCIKETKTNYFHKENCINMSFYMFIFLLIVKILYVNFIFAPLFISVFTIYIVFADWTKWAFYFNEHYCLCLISSL